MRSSAKVLFMLLTLALAVPAVVHAQSAGDDQYVDPFEGQGGGGGGNGGGDNGSQTGGSDDGTTSTTAQTTPSDTAGTSAEGTAAQSEATLPRTGFTLLPVAIFGALLLGAGAVLRRGARLPSAMPSMAGAPALPRAALPRAALPVRPPAPPVRCPADPAATSRSGLPAVGVGLVGLFILSKVLRRRA
jgi:hypothetical protein